MSSAIVHRVESAMTRLHSTSRSARASKAGCTSIPSALAVFRLITSSNAVGRSMGDSAGLSLQNAIDVIGKSPVGFGEFWSVGAQRTGVRKIGPTRDNRDAQNSEWSSPGHRVPSPCSGSTASVPIPLIAMISSFGRASKIAELTPDPPPVATPRMREPTSASKAIGSTDTKVGARHSFGQGPSRCWPSWVLPVAVPASLSLPYVERSLSRF
jgi:hypothetical protein